MYRNVAFSRYKEENAKWNIDMANERNHFRIITAIHDPFRRGIRFIVTLSIHRSAVE